VLEVAEMMVNRNIGAVPVLKDGNWLVSHERDLMSRVVVLERIRANAVGDVMTEDPSPSNPKTVWKPAWFSCGAMVATYWSARAQTEGVVSLRDILLHDLDEKDDEVA